MTPFLDHFSKQATFYARARPTYPDALFTYLAEIAPALEMAWDVGAGNGQAALGLRRHFRGVIATDASVHQLSNATRAPGIDYRVATAEDSQLPAASADLIAVAQALHWFDRPRFFAEAGRVARPGGVLAVWCYAMTQINPAVDEVLNEFYHDVVGPHWPPGRIHVERGYADFTLPGQPLTAPGNLFVEAQWDLEKLMRYLRSWSATQRYIDAIGNDPRELVSSRLAAAWGHAAESRRVRWPLFVRAVRLPSPGL